MTRTAEIECRVAVLRVFGAGAKYGAPYWSLYNAVSEAVDHGRFYGWRGQGRQRAENRMTSVLMGAAADFKQEAFDLAVAMAS